MSEEIIKVLDYIGEKLGIAIDWTQANALPYAQELFEKYISYEVWTSVFWVLITVIPTVIFIKLAIVAFKKMDKAPLSDWDIVFGITASVAAIFGVSAIVVLPVQFIDIITCATFPEKILLELLKSVAG